MILVRAITRKALKGENIKRVRVRDTRRDFTRYVVTGIENTPAALSSDHLQRQVSDLRLARFFHAFYILLVIKGPKSPSVVGPQRIDRIQRNAGAPQAVGNCDNLTKNFLLLFGG